jgi:hypothetical protein
VCERRWKAHEQCVQATINTLAVGPAEGANVKSIRIVGIAAVAAMAVMAFGAASASATTLCKISSVPCPEAQKYAAGTQMKALSGEVVFEWTQVEPQKQLYGTTRCEKSEFNSSLSKSTGTPLPFATETLTFLGNCSAGSGSCVFSAQHKAGTIEWTAGTKGVLSLPLEFSVSCAGFPGISCTYRGEPKFEFQPTTAESSAKLVLNENVPLEHVSGSLNCTNEARIHSGVTYVIQTPHSIYVSK